MENEKPVTIKYPILIEEVPCPKCGIGTMEFNSEIYDPLEGKFRKRHVCFKCGYMADYNESYPRFINGHDGKEVIFY